MSWLVVVPAYGRWYPSNEAMRADWEAGKDFQIVNGPYLSKRDLEAVLKIYLGVQILQRRRTFELKDGRLCRIPFLTEEIR